MFSKVLITSLVFSVSINGLAQQQLMSSVLIPRLDSIRMSTGKGSHFAELYLQTTIAADMYRQTLPSEAGRMMKKLAQNFAEYFFRAIDASNAGDEVPHAWENYFNGNKLSSLQLKLMRANAHINGDIWQALINSFSLAEFKTIKPFYKQYNETINKVFSDLFESAIGSDKRLRNLHSITLGLDKVVGKIVLKKWRNRQLRLAALNLEQHEKFERLKKEQIIKKKELTE